MRSKSSDAAASLGCYILVIGAKAQCRPDFIGRARELNKIDQLPMIIGYRLIIVLALPSSLHADLKPTYGSSTAHESETAFSFALWSSFCAYRECSIRWRINHTLMYCRYWPPSRRNLPSEAISWHFNLMDLPCSLIRLPRH